MRDGYDFYVEPQNDENENEGEDFVVAEQPSPAEVEAFWNDSRTDRNIPF